MPNVSHPVLFVERFLKEAAAAKPQMYGVGDAVKRSKGKVPRGPQTYTAPTPPTSVTQPELVSNQKAVPPPPVT